MKMDKNLDKSRRDFIAKSMAGLAGTAFLPAVMTGEEEKKEEKKKWKIVTRTLGKTGIELPVISMGCGAGDDPDVIRAALDAGVVHLDTANSYSNGQNEVAVAAAVKDRPRDSYVVATKIHMPQDNKTGFFPEDTKPEAFMEKFEASMKRLGLEYVDILYLHDVIKKEAAMFDPFVKTMVKLKKEGRVKHLGAAFHRNEPEMLRVVADSGIYEVALTAYNYRQPHRDEMDQAINYAAKKGIGIVGMKVLAGFYLDRERTQEVNVAAALKWALLNKNVCTLIPGFNTFDAMVTDLSVMGNLNLTPEEKADIKKTQLASIPGLYCQQCDTCLAQCKKDLDIPTLMRSYMYAHGYRRPGKAKFALRQIDLSDLPCEDCGDCRVACAMGFDVKEKILDIARVNSVPDDFLV